MQLFADKYRKERQKITTTQERKEKRDKLKNQYIQKLKPIQKEMVKELTQFIVFMFN